MTDSERPSRGAEDSAPPQVPVEVAEAPLVDGPDAHRRRLQGDLVRGSLWTAVTAVVGLPLTLIVNLVLARSLGADGLGQLGTLIAAYALVSLAVNLGWSDATVQWLAAARARGDRAIEVELVRSCVGYHCFIEGPVLAALTVAVLWRHGLGTALVAAGAILVIQAMGTSTVILTATARNALAARVALVVTMAGQVTTMSVATTTHDPFKTWSAQMVLATLGPAVAFIRLEPALRKAMLRPRFPPRAPSGFLGFALSACASGLVGSLVWGRSELFVLSGLGMAEEAGIFVVVTGLAAQITVPMDSLMGPLMPTAAGLVAAAPGLAVAALTRALRVSAMLGAFTVSGAAPLAVVVMVPLYGDDFADGQVVLAVLVAVSCLQSVSGPMLAFAFATRSAPALLRANLICLMVDAALALSLIPLVGLWGAVAASAVAQILSLVLLTRISRRSLGVSTRELVRSTRTFYIGAALGTAAALVCALPGLSVLARILLVGLGPVALMMVLRWRPVLRLTADDAASILRGMPDRLSHVAEPLMRHLQMIEADRR